MTGRILAEGELSRGGGAVDLATLTIDIWAVLLTVAAGLAIALPIHVLLVCFGL
jgi:biopolymer transport protein ExbB/TolQ